MQGIQNFDTYDLEDVGLEDFRDLIWYYSRDYDCFNDATLEIMIDLR